MILRFGSTPSGSLEKVNSYTGLTTEIPNNGNHLEREASALKNLKVVKWRNK